MAGSRDSFLCGAGRRFSVIRVPRGSEIVMLDGRRTRAADSEGNHLSEQSGSLCLCFHAASDSLGVCRGRCRNKKWRPYWLTPGLSHREQLTELRLPLPALRWKIFQLPLSPETCCEPRPRCVSAARADLRSGFSLPESLLQLCDTWRTSCGPFSLLIMVVELNVSYYSTRMDWRLLYILLGLTESETLNEVTVWKQFPHVWQMKRWTTGDDNHGLLGR